MKSELEQIPINPLSSFRLMINPNLSDFFFWHFHPELELVLLDGADGVRHVGEHIGRFEQSDLVFIGANIPHLNFDYGIKTKYEKVVVHFKEDFLKGAFGVTSELSPIATLFENSKYGVAFGTKTKSLISERLKNLNNLQPFELFIEMLCILRILAQADDMQLLHKKEVVNPFNQKEQSRLKKIYTFIDTHYQNKITIEQVAQLCHLTHPAFCRYFKRMTKLTFTAFLQHYRINEAKMLLRKDNNVTETCFQCGFESISYFNKVFKKVTGQNPLAFKKGFE